MTSKTCKSCGEEFTREQINERLAKAMSTIAWQRRKFCDLKCQRSFEKNKLNMQTKFDNMTRVRRCDLCKTEYIYKGRISRFCSKKCYERNRYTTKLKRNAEK